MPDTSSETKGGGAALTRRNLKAFTVKQRKETARRRGRSTPSASPDFHSYCETMSSDLPRLHWQPKKPKATASEMAADYARIEENLPLLRPARPPSAFLSPEPQSPAHTIDGKNEHGPTGQINSPRQAQAASVSDPDSDDSRRHDRLILRHPKRTASEIAADNAEWEKWYDENLPPRPRVAPLYPFLLPAQGLPAQGSPVCSTDERGAMGQPDSPREATSVPGSVPVSVAASVPASVPARLPGSMPGNVPDDGAPQHGMAGDAASQVSAHSKLAEPVVPGMDDGLAPAEYDDGHPGGQYDNEQPVQYDNGYPPGQYDWGYAPPQPGLPTDRPTIPRQPPSVDAAGNPGPRFPANFPAYHATQNMNEIAAYLANASYVVSLGGTPLADLKYGIIIVPAGEESLLFGPPPQSVINQEFIDAIDDANRDYDRALRMYDPDKDIEEYALHRFDDDFASVSAGAQRNVETTLANEKGGVDEHGVEHGVEDDDSATEDVEEPRPKRPRTGPRVVVDETASSRQDASPPGKARRNVKRATPAMNTLKPQETAKARRSSRVAGKGSNSSPQPAVKRTLRGRK